MFGHVIKSYNYIIILIMITPHAYKWIHTRVHWHRANSKMEVIRASSFRAYEKFTISDTRDLWTVVFITAGQTDRQTHTQIETSKYVNKVEMDKTEKKLNKPLSYNPI